MAKGKVIHSGDACTVLIGGDKHARAEPTTHVIQFPGGYMEVSRVSDNEYWAHIWVNKKQVLDDVHVLSKPGEIVRGRVDRNVPAEGDRTVVRVEELDYPEMIEHVAVRIKTNGSIN